MAWLKLKIVIIGSFLLFLPFNTILAENLLIVEVQIAGDSSNNDYIKIYNPQNQEVDVSGYKLRKRSSTGSESSIKVFPNGSKISAKGFFIWANSQNDYYLKINADIWSSATLAKNNSVALLNLEGKIIDALTWGKSQNPFVKGLPFPENPGPNQQLKRKKINGVYQNTNNNSQDFFIFPIVESKIENSKEFPNTIKEKTQENQSATQEDQITSSEKNLSENIVNYPSAVFFNEILPNTPLGQKDEEKEYIEIFNQNDFEVDLTNWKIEDLIGKTNTFLLPTGTKIKGKGFLVFYRTQTKITLNNNGDGLKLLDPDGKIIDTITFQKAPRGKSYNKTKNGWLWSDYLTPGTENVVEEKERGKNEEISFNQNQNLIEKKSEEGSKKALAEIEQFSPKEKNSLFLLIVAFTISLFSGIIILVLKNIIKKDFS